MTITVKQASYQKEKENINCTWDVYLDDIAGRSSESRSVVARSVGVTDAVLRKMTPIHPMAALMLKHISERFASNQRSMFNFIKSFSVSTYALTFLKL